MILVVLGTHELPFPRLLKEVEGLKRENVIHDDIMVQHGHTNYHSDLMTLKPFVAYEEMGRLYDDAKYIITHAGTGSVIMGLRKEKQVIAAPRLAKYGEHNDDHQLELADVFYKEGHILCWHDGEPFSDVINQLETFKPKPFQSKREQLFRLVESFIEEV